MDRDSNDNQEEQGVGDGHLNNILEQLPLLQASNAQGLSSEVSSSQAKKRKGRGPTKAIQTRKPMFLEFDEFDLPTGEWEKKYGQQIGQCALKIDINIHEWGSVDQASKDSLWEETKRMFHIDEDPKGARKKNFLIALGSRFRHHKSWLVSRFVDRTTAPPEGSPNANIKPWELYEGFITEDQWKIFELYVTSEKFKTKSAIGKNVAEKHIHRHTLGQKSYSRKRKDWIKEKRISAPCESTSGDSSVLLNERLKNRALEWCLAHQKRTQDGKWEVDPKKPETVRVVNLVMEELEKEAMEDEEGKTTEPGYDALTKVLGKKDNRGYVKGLGRCGVGIGYEKVFGKVKGSKSTQSGCSFEELEAVKANLTKEFEEKFEAKLQERVATEVQSYLGSLSNFKMLTDVLQAADPNEQETISDQQPRVIEAMTKCHLAVNDVHDLGSLVVVAEGTVQPTTTEGIHKSSILPDHYRVRIDKPYEEHKKVDLPVPLPKGVKKLGKAKKRVVQWPISLVLFEDKVVTPPSKKVKSSSRNKEIVGSCGLRAEVSSCVRIEAMIEDDLVENLTEECELLYYKMCDLNQDTISISLEAPLFYLMENKEILVTSNDVSQFLRGAWANVSLVHVYILYLVQDFISVFNISEITFLCPQRISASEMKRDFGEAQFYLKNAFLSELKKNDKHCKFILAPYIQDNHWILIVIDLRTGVAFVFDPANQPNGKPRPLVCQKTMMIAYKIYRSSLKESALKKSNPSLVWKPIKCAQQNRGEECGYYVMRYMYEIFARHRECKGDLQEEYMGRSAAFNDIEMTNVREQWAKFFRTTFLLK